MNYSRVNFADEFMQPMLDRAINRNIVVYSQRGIDAHFIAQLRTTTKMCLGEDGSFDRNKFIHNDIVYEANSSFPVDEHIQVYVQEFFPNVRFLATDFKIKEYYLSKDCHMPYDTKELLLCFNAALTECMIGAY